MSTTLKNALALAERGFYVFPLKANTKIPLIKWREGSTRDGAIIRSWFKDIPPNLGIDCGKSGLVVVDVDEKTDPKTGIKKEGKKSVAKLEAEGFIFTDTLMVETPTDGLHFYYKSEGLANSAGTFAPDIDIRADGGYVVAPGSEIDSKPYKIVPPEVPILPIPPWMAERCRKVIPREERQTEVVLSEDANVDIEWAKDFLKNYPGAVEGDGGDQATYVMFCRLKERGISMREAISLAYEVWNENCSPPWDIEELTIKAENAYAYAQKATGSLSPAFEFDEPQVIKPKPEHKLPALIEGDLYRRSVYPDASSIPKRQKVFGELALRKQVTVLVAPGGTGKSTFTIGIGLSKASGLDFMGMDPYAPGRVLIYNNEDNLEEIYRRETAARQHFDLSREDLSDAHGARLFYGTGDIHMLRVMKKLKDGNLAVEKEVESLTGQIIRDKIDLVVIDPLAQTHNADENDNGQMLRVGETFLSIAQKAGCAVILVHHTRKRDKSSADGHSGNMDSLRGASSVASLARVVATLDTMSRETATKLLGKKNIDKRHRYVEFMFAKANMSAITHESIIYEKTGVTIGITEEYPDGESVGVLQHVHLNAAIPEPGAADKELLEALCALTGGETVRLADALRLLAGTNPFYQGIKYDTVARRVRGYARAGEIELPGGMMYTTEDMSDRRHPVVIRFVKHKSIEDIL